MKVLFCNRNPAIGDGGDTNKITNYMERLEKVGIKCGYTYTVRGDLSEWDIFHIFHLGHDWSYKFHLEAQRLGKPTVISPVYFPSKPNPFVYRREMLEYTSAVCYLSDGEKESVHRLFDNGIRLNEHIIPNGVNPVFGEDGPSIKHPNCPNEDFVLCVGRLDARKNQHRLAEACRQLDIPLFLIGEPAEKTVVQACQGIADKWPGLWWEGPAPHEKLAEAYRGAKVLACPSTLEMWPNVVAEGGLAGCNLVVTRESFSFSDLDGVWPCEPTVRGIKDAVGEAYNAEKTGDMREYFRQFTWESAVSQLRDVYESIYVT